MTMALVLGLAAVCAVASYWWLERIGARGWVAVTCRAIAWGTLGVLVLNASCATSVSRGWGGGAPSPLVLLDASLSMAGRPDWSRMRDSAHALGEVRFFGDDRSSQDTSRLRGQSRLGPALRAAASTDRAIRVLTDGELDDGADIPDDLLARASVTLFPREPKADAAITRLTGPARITRGDSLTLEGEVAVSPSTVPGSGTIMVRGGERVLAQRRVSLEPGGRPRFRVTVPSRGLRSGAHLLEVSLSSNGDEDERNDARLHRLDVVPTPGVVLVADPADWDAKFLYRTLADVAELPVRGYVRVADGVWHAMRDLRVVPDREVRRAARNADLLIVKGRDPREGVAQTTRARGLWHWPSGEGGETQLAGDWYLAAEAVSPIAHAFLGLPVDSFPPATRVTPVEPRATDWTALSAQAGRRGAPRPVVIGREQGGRRRILVTADGLWRWAFRGGSSEQGYRAWVAATTTWLLSGRDPSMGRAVPIRPVVEHSRPVTFRWTAQEPADPLPIRLEGPDGPIDDTLRFDGGGEASVWLPPGAYRYRVSGEEATGVIGVERYSDEWGVRRVTLSERDASMVQRAASISARELLWLFGLCIMAFTGEWMARRRLGLR